MENYMRLECEAISENEIFTRNAVAFFALPLEPDISELSDIKTAVSEAVTNCIVHAYGKGKGIITLECKIEGRTLHIKVSDKGRGIDNVEEAIQPFFTTLPDEERSGIGFTIMQTFMSDFKVESALSQGTTVFMSKVIGTGKKEDA
ncbi:MAG: anti-sigma F factor [Clostridia bacterium]|nr:anti-sigma F factor [Clostridia bacterium]